MGLVVAVGVAVAVACVGGGAETVGAAAATAAGAVPVGGAETDADGLVTIGAAPIPIGLFAELGGGDGGSSGISLSTGALADGLTSSGVLPPAPFTSTSELGVEGGFPPPSFVIATAPTVRPISAATIDVPQRRPRDVVGGLGAELMKGEAVSVGPGTGEPCCNRAWGFEYGPLAPGVSLLSRGKGGCE